MAHAVEARPPFLDDRIVDFATRLPQRFKISGRQTKLVLRQLMKDRLPHYVLNRPKIGLDIPIHEWFRGILLPLLTETLNETSVEESGLFRWPTVKALIESHLNYKANWGYHWQRNWRLNFSA